MLTIMGLSDSTSSVNGSDVSVFLTVLAASLVTVWTYQKTKKQSNHPLPPGPWGFPVIGHLPLLGKRPDITLQQMSKKYGDVFQIFMGSRRTIVVNSVEAAKQVLSKQSDDFAGRPNFMSFRFIGDGKSMTFSRYGETWKLHKRVLRSALRMFVQSPSVPVENAIQDEANILVKDVLSKQGEPQDVKDSVFEAAGSVIFGLCFGAKTDLRSEPYFLEFKESQKIFQETQKAGGNPADLFPWLESFFAGRLKKFKETTETFGKTARAIQAKHKADYTADHLRDITDALIKVVDDYGGDEGLKKIGLSERHIMGCTGDLIGAGLNTVWHTLRWAMLYLTVYPDIQAQVQKQIDNVIGQNLPKPEDRKHLPLVEATLLETWRYASLVPFLLPHAATRDTTLYGYHIPEGSMVFVNMRAVGRDGKVWKNPDTFDPTRFLDEDGNVDKNAGEDALPFGGGARRCAGELLARIETFIFLTRLLQCCKFEKVPGVAYDLEPAFNFAFEPLPHELIVTPREA